MELDAPAFIDGVDPVDTDAPSIEEEAEMDGECVTETVAARGGEADGDDDSERLTVRVRETDALPLAHADVRSLSVTVPLGDNERLGAGEFEGDPDSAFDAEPRVVTLGDGLIDGATLTDAL